MVYHSLEQNCWCCIASCEGYTPSTRHIVQAMQRKASGISRLDHYFSLLLQLIQPQPDASPKFAKQDPVPVLSHWSCSVFTLSHALWPWLVQLAYSRLHDGESLPFAWTLLLFIAAHVNMTVRAGTVLISLGAK